MVVRRRYTSGEDGSRPSYAGLGSRIEDLLRLAGEQRDQIIAEARQEAAAIVDEARRQAEQILASARAQAGQLGGVQTAPGAGQEPWFDAGVNPFQPPVTQLPADGTP